MSHASLPGVSPSYHPRETTDVPRAAIAPKKEPAVCPTDDEAQIPRKGESKNTRSLDYVWRSGIAGGVAGCAVSRPKPSERTSILYVLTFSRPKRSSHRSTASRFSSSRTTRSLPSTRGLGPVLAGR